MRDINVNIVKLVNNYVEVKSKEWDKDIRLISLNYMDESYDDIYTIIVYIGKKIRRINIPNWYLYHLKGLL